MSQAIPIKPDLDFTEQIIQSGATDLKLCFQCATCSVACELSPDERPFPRKEMIWAQWGLKDRLLSDPDVWLCHRCNDCSVRCPRGSSPGDVMAAIRRQTVLNYAAPRFLRDWISRPWILPLSMLIPAILLVLALLVRDPLGNALGFAPHRGAGMEYANLFPHWLLIAFFTFFLGLAVLLGVLGVIRFWKAMAAADAAGNRGSAERSILSSLVRVAIDIVAHSRFTICRNNPNTRSAHLTAFYGFWALFLVSAWAVILLYVLNPFLASDPFLYPFPFWNPAKVIANLGALALVAGAVIAIRDRSKDGPEIGHSSAFDWWFLWTLLAVGVTGILTEVMRFAQAESAGYVVYFVHLVLAFTLLTYLPYSKFAHIFYRTAAMVYAEHRGRRPHSAVQPQAK